jgi:N-acetylneuraminic acid mutarotase
MMTRARTPAVVAALLLAVPTLIVQTLDARADSTALASSSFPSSGSTSAVWDGLNAYVFGGATTSTPLSQIVRYQPGTNAVTVLGATLPTARMGTSAVWDGNHAYVFGGWDGAAYSSQIVRYTPGTGAVVVVGSLPSGRAFTSAAWDGTSAYVFGGNPSTAAKDIVRFTPSTGAVVNLGAKLPTSRAYTSAVWDGASAYVFGGGDYASTNDIVRYTPATGAVTVMGATLPPSWSLSRTSAVWDGANAYLFGGLSSSYLTQIVRYTPSTDTATVMSATLPDARALTSAVWDGTSAYVFGGSRPGVTFGQVVRYDLKPGAPQSLAAASGPVPGLVTLTWQPPPSNTYSGAISAYNVWRGPTSGGQAAAPLATVSGATTTFTDPACIGTCYYKVSATSAAGEGPRSNEASAGGIPLPSGRGCLPAGYCYHYNERAPGSDCSDFAVEYVVGAGPCGDDVGYCVNVLGCGRIGTTTASPGEECVSPSPTTLCVQRDHPEGICRQHGVSYVATVGFCEDGTVVIRTGLGPSLTLGPF